MAEIVDSIVAELIARDNGYISTFDRAITKHKEFSASVPKIDGIEVLSKGAKQYADQHAQSLGKVIKDEEQASQRIANTRKKRVAEAKASDEAEVASAKKAAKEKADAEIIEAQRSARARKAVERGLAARAAAIAPGSGTIPNSDLSRGGARLFIPPAAMGGSQAELAATEEIDRVTRDIAINKARLVGLEGQEREELQREIRYLETYNRLKKVGVAETEAQVLAERELVAAESRRGLFRRSATRTGLGEANQFALGASRGRFGYSFSPGALAGVAVAAGGFAATAAIEHSINLAKALQSESQQLGVTTTQLQVYRKAAEDLGVTQEQLSSAFGQFNSNLGKAQGGASEQSKVFAALGISITNVDGSLRNAGDVLPQVIDRLSSLKDESQRAAVETALFGETGRKLDGLLSGGTDAVNNLADAMQRAGSVLSPQDVQTLADAGKVLGDVKRQLEVDISRIVAGNADAIEGLARAFGNLVTKIQSTLAWIRHVSAESQVFTGYVEKYVGGPAFAYSGAEDIATGRRKLENERMDAQEAAIQANPLSHLNLFAKPDSGKVDRNALAKLFAPKGRKGPDLAKRADQRDRRADAELARLKDEELDAQRELTTGAEERYKLQLEQIDRDHDRKANDIRHQAAEHQIDAARVKELQAENDKVREAQIQVAIARRDSQLAQEQLRARQQTRDAYLSELRTQESLATTAAERRRLALAELSVQRKSEIEAAQSVLNDPLATAAQRAAATNELDPNNPQGINARYEYARTAALYTTQGPLGQYLSALPRTKDQLDEAFQLAAVHGLQNLNDGLSEAVDKFLHLHGIAGEFLSDLIKIGIEREVMIPLANSLFPTQSKAAGGGGGGLFGSIIKAAGSLLGGGSSVGSWLNGGSTSGLGFGGSFMSIPGFASGGSGIIGGRPGVDQNVLSINGVPQLRVSKDELLTVSPNAALSNQRVNAPAPQQNIVVVQPIHADFSGARTDEQTMRQFTAYADARSRQAYQAAVATAGSQVSGIVKRQQSLGS